MSVKTVNREWEMGILDLRTQETRKPSLDLNAFLDPTRTIAKEMQIAKKVDEKQLTETEIQLSRKLNKIPR